MEFPEYQQMFQLESTHWYFRGKREILQNVIRNYLHGHDNKLLDIGCGTGKIMEELSQFGDVYGIDSSEIALAFCRQRGLTNLYLVCENKTYPFPDGYFDAICAFDILEHLPCEENMVYEIKRIARAGAYVFITVPSFGFLWSTHDVALHHFRRYSSGQIKMLLEKNGFQIERLTFFIFFLFPIAAVYRTLNRWHPKKKKIRSEFFIQLPKWINSLFFYIILVEKFLLKFICLPFGVSILCIARIPEKLQR